MVIVKFTESLLSFTPVWDYVAGLWLRVSIMFQRLFKDLSCSPIFRCWGFFRLSQIL